MKKLLAVLAGLVTLTFTAIIVAVLYVGNFDPNERKDWIADKFLESTGHTLAIEGPIELTKYPWLGITLNNVTIGNSPGFSQTPLLTAEYARIRLKVLPVLSGIYEIDTIQLLGTSVNLEIDGSGRSNWQDMTGASDDSDSAGSASSGLTINSIRLGGVDIQNLNLSYTDQQANTYYEASNLNFRTDALTFGEPLNYSLSLNALSRQPAIGSSINLNGTVLYDLDNERYDLNPLNLNATITGPNVPGGSAEVTLQSNIDINLQEDTISLEDVEFDALGAHLSSNMLLSNISASAPAIEANLNLSGDDLAVFFKVLDIPELATQVSSLNSEGFSITANMSADLEQGEINIPVLQGNLLGTNLSAVLNGSRITTDNPVITGQIQANGSDLPLLLEVAGLFAGGRDSELSVYGRDLSRVPDKAFNLNTDFNLNMQNGNLTVSSLAAGLLGANLDADFVASRINTDTPALRGSIQTSGPDLPLLMQIAGQLTQGTDSALNDYGRQLRTGVRNRAFDLSANFTADLESGDISVPVLQANLLGFRLNGNLGSQNMQSNNGTVNGALTLTGSNLAEVLNAIEQPDLAEIARSMTLEIGISGTRNALQVSPMNMDLVVAGGNIGNNPVTLTMTAETTVNLNDESARISAFSVSGLGLNLNGNLNASANNYSGQINLANFNARRFMTQLNLDVPVTADPSVLQNVSLGATINGSENNITVSDLAIRLDDSRVSGNFAINDFSTQDMEFDLSVDAINADRYLAPVTETASTSEGSDELPVDTIKALRMKGELDIGQLTISDLKLANIAVAINAGDGLLAVNPIQASLYNGTYTGDIRVDTRNAVPTASLNTSLQGINLAPLMSDFMDASYVSGTGNIQLALTARGNAIPSIKENLNGTGSVNLTDGVLTGVDVGAVLKRIETMIRSRRLADLPQGGQTSFDNFSATLAINNGVVNSNDLLIESPGFKVTGSGTLINLANERINYNLVTSVDRSTAETTDQVYDIGGYSLPIACTGSIASPRCLPDAQQIISSAVTNVIEQRLGDFIQQRLGGTGTQTDNTGTQSTPDNATPAPAEEEESNDPAEQLINRALDRLFQ